MKQEIKLSGDVVKTVESFKYLRLGVQKYRGFEEDTKHRDKCGRIKLKDVPGVLRNKSILIMLKSKFFKIVVRTALTFGTEY